ncbi:MAG: DNA polymerase III subunit gamma/tau [Flavobacteriales bacterium]|nr:DNA polymerase III subunit gamma/tau [Flavobacteriales bacterium]
MGPFIVSARKYRPATFDTVVGQEAVTETLKNAIRTGHLAQAFLFTGPRGVGKTTCARILARTINCEQLHDDLSTCGECAPCKTFEEGHSLNIFELDAASNNSVDDIRNLILQVQIAPQVGTKKVYIIDEVHMLSAAAFNAFLKTLEEPPSYAIFILATTEKHKILPTILSRCQVFDFRRITVADTVRHLAGIAVKEDIQAEPQALHVIAQKADGGLRDALSIFDQLVSFSGHRLSYQDVVTNLNVLDHEHYFSITEAILKGDTAACLLEFDTILRNGFDGHLFIAGLGHHFRDLLVARDPRTIGLLEVSEDLNARYLKQGAAAPRHLLFDGLERIAQCDAQYKLVKEPRLLVELTLIQLCRLADKGDADNGNAAMPAAASAPPATAKATAPGNVSAEASTLAQKKSPDGPVAPPQATATPAPAPVKATSVAAPDPVRRSTGLPSLRQIQAEAERVQAPVAAPPSAAPEETALDKPEAASLLPVNNALLLKVWKDYALERKREGKNSLHATLVAREPEPEGPGKVRFVIVNEVQEKYMREEKPALLGHLRRALGDEKLELEIVKVEVTDNRPRYTPKDRFNLMAERNPALLKLREELDLDLG